MNAVMKDKRQHSQSPKSRYSHMYMGAAPDMPIDCIVILESSVGCIRAA